MPGVKVVVWVPDADRQALEQEGKDPKGWVKEMFAKMLEARREGKS